MLSIAEIKQLIDNDSASVKKQQARKGVQYYEGDHDIRNFRIFFVNGKGEPEEDKTKSNIKIAHPFFTENVDQTVQYLLSGDGYFFKSDDPNLQKDLNERFNENDAFISELYELVTGSQVKGFEYMYAYKNAEGRSVFECADGMGVVEVRAKESQDKCDHLIYWYVDRIGKDNKTIKRIEVWDAHQTYYYYQEDNGSIVFDDEAEHNPRPHTIYKKDKDENTYFEDYGRIPFFRLDNGRKQFSALKPIKHLIDDYDLMNCGLSNNIQDTNEALYVVRGFEGNNLDELMQNIKAKKHIGLPEEGGVEIQTISIPVEARKEKMEVDEQNIYRFGFALDTHGLKDTAATTNLAIESAYSLLGMKARKLIIRLKEFLRGPLGIVLDEINKEKGTDYQQKDVYFRFKPEVPTNALENAQIALIDAQKRQTEINTILSLAGRVDDDTTLQLICEQLDIDFEEVKGKAPKEDDFSGIYPEEEIETLAGGGLIE